MALGAADDGVDASNQLILMERLGHVVIGTETEAADLVIDANEARQDQNWRRDLADAQGLEDFISAHIRKIDIEENDVVIIKLAKIDPLFAEVGGVAIKAFRLQHQLDALSRRAIIFDQKNPHVIPLSRDPS